MLKKNQVLDLLKQRVVTIGLSYKQLGQYANSDIIFASKI